ncbi:nuclear transport factor 2 family protein [Massilia aurea]|uniref:nuclear transport factor 2 family protein n=1 Tax=Massilia aurea TaxID=373040 RepID=UPI003462A1D0
MPGPSGTTAQSPVLTALRDAEQRRAEAIATRDVDALRNVIATDYYHVETNGRVRTRSEFLQLLARDEFEFRSYAIASMEIQLLDSGRSAVIRGRFQADLQQNGRTREFRGRYVRVWQLQADGWRNTMMQSTEIKPAR